MWNFPVLHVRLLSSVLVLLLCPYGELAAATTRPTSKPNVLLITIDTLRADHLGCYGYRQIKTPNIDNLPRDGIRLEKAFTPVPITLPAHAALLSGTYPMYNGLHDFSGNKLNPAQPT